MLSASFARLDTRTDLAVGIWHQLYASGEHLLLAQYLTHLTVSAPVLNSLTPNQLRAAAEQTASTLPSGTGAQVDLVRLTDVRADLEAVTAPTLVVLTTADPLIPAALRWSWPRPYPGRGPRSSPPATCRSCSGRTSGCRSSPASSAGHTTVPDRRWWAGRTPVHHRRSSPAPEPRI